MWEWKDVRSAINDSDGQYAAFVGKLPRTEIERLMVVSGHHRDVLGHFNITPMDAARIVYDEIRSRALRGMP